MKGHRISMVEQIKKDITMETISVVVECSETFQVLIIMASIILLTYFIQKEGLYRRLITYECTPPMLYNKKIK